MMVDSQVIQWNFEVSRKPDLRVLMDLFAADDPMIELPTHDADRASTILLGDLPPNPELITAPVVRRLGDEEMLTHSTIDVLPPSSRSAARGL